MILAVTESWPEASIAIAGIVFITTVISVAIWQVFATGRTGMSVKREQAYKTLAEQATEAQQRTAEELEKAVSELTLLRRQTTELERLLKEVE